MTETKRLVLDIAMNLNRIGNWAADGYDAKQKRILLFLNQTKDYIGTLDHVTVPQPLHTTLQVFIPIFRDLYHEGLSKPKDTDIWAEKMMTWGNILTHRASLLN